MIPSTGHIEKLKFTELKNVRAQNYDNLCIIDTIT